MSFAVLKHMRDQFKVNVLSVEYPGYGLLHHMPTNEDAVYEVALTAFRFLVDEVNVRYSQIILFGRSLGSGPAVYLAAQYPVGGLILVNAISSVKAAVQSVAGRLIAWTWRERFPNHKIIANVSCSTLFIHGECDGLLPPEHSLRLFKRCRARKLLITPPKMEHNSNLFGDASFLAVPAIHFFGFPGYYTSTPPRLPAVLFENPERRARIREQMKEESTGSQPWLCGCLAKGDPHHLDVTFCRQEHSVEDITIRFSESPNAEGSGAGNQQAQANSSSSQPTEPTSGPVATSNVNPLSKNSGDTTENIAEIARGEIAHFPSRNTASNIGPTATQTGNSSLPPSASEGGSRLMNGFSSSRIAAASPPDFTPSTPPALNRTLTPLEREELMIQEEVQLVSDQTTEAQPNMAFPAEIPMPQGELEAPERQDTPEEKLPQAAPTDAAKPETDAKPQELPAKPETEVKLQEDVQAPPEERREEPEKARAPEQQTPPELPEEVPAEPKLEREVTEQEVVEQKPQELAQNVASAREEESQHEEEAKKGRGEEVVDM
jgi:hypothetical protein